MRASQFFLSTLKEAPSEAELPSHKLMLRAGLIRQEAAGIYAWLPLGLRVLEAGPVDDRYRVPRNVKALIRYENLTGDRYVELRRGTGERAFA